MKTIDETGHRYGKLVVISRAKNEKHGQAMWLCQCDCGEQTTARGYHLRQGRVKSCSCGQGKPKELSGQRFGKLVAIEPLEKRNAHGSVVWRCKCDCGNESNVSAANLGKKGGTRSCGCSHTLPPGEAAFNALLKNYTYSAKRRGLTFELTKAQFRELTKQRCHYCGQEPSREHGDPGLNGTYTCNGLDRKDNIEGYTLSNVVPCCQVCNFTKASRDYNEFTEWIDQVVRFHLGRTNKERTNDRHEV